MRLTAISEPDALLAPPWPAEESPLDFTGLCTLDPLHDVGHFLDRFDFAALETMSPAMQENARRAIRARNDRLLVGRRMLNLEGAFCVGVVLKELLKREERHPPDMIATGGEVGPADDQDDNFEDKTINTVVSLDLVTKRFTTLAPMITARECHATGVLDGKLFVMGGWNHGWLSSVECLDLETGQWSEVTPMIRSREAAGAAVLGGKIFVAGGYPWAGGGQALVLATSVESFDPATQQWSAEVSMNIARCTHGLVAAQGKLFAIGGLNPRDGTLKSVECFDPPSRVWRSIAPLNTARSHPAVAVLDDKLYAIGGMGPEPLSSVECLDLSVPNGQWTTVAPMITARAGIKGAVVTGGKMYIAGGGGKIYDGGGLSSSSIECFSPNDGPTGVWTVVNNTSGFANAASFAAC